MADLLRCFDVHGRNVILTAECWQFHILPGRTVLAGQEQQIRVVLAAPTRIMRDATHHDRECFYRLGALPGDLANHYFKVVVEFEGAGPGGGSTGYVVTAYPTDRIKRKEQQLWPK